MRFLFLIIFSFTFNAVADTQVKTQIHDVDLGSGKDEPLIFLSTGQVVSLKKNKIEILKQLREGLLKKTWFTVTLNDQRQILNLKAQPPLPKLSPKMSFEKMEVLDAPFEPSILKNLDAARSFFYDARTDHQKESQCYNRAHVWTYDWRTKHKFYSNKVWLFFTRKFIRKYKFEWWFHVSPMVHAVIDGKVRQRVMDVKYARGPLRLKEWTDIFMRDNSDCPVVDRYSDYADYPESGSCFVMKSSMYYYQPVDLELAQVLSRPKTLWVEQEVVHAFDEAFQSRPGE